MNLRSEITRRINYVNFAYNLDTNEFCLG